MNSMKFDLRNFTSDGVTVDLFSLVGTYIVFIHGHVFETVRVQHVMSMRPSHHFDYPDEMISTQVQNVYRFWYRVWCTVLPLWVRLSHWFHLVSYSSDSHVPTYFMEVYAACESNVAERSLKPPEHYKNWGGGIRWTKRDGDYSRTRLEWKERG